jgi:RNA polymerase sigma-70 factor (ECF subfamily)
MSRDTTEIDAEALFAGVLSEFGPALRRIAGSYEPRSGRRDDLFQEIALALWQALPRFRGECSMRTFVFRVAHNRALTQAARRSRGETLDVSEADHLTDPADDPETQTARRQQRDRLDRAIRRLPILQRQVLLLALEDLSHAEIGGVLGIKENAVAVRLSRARQALRDALGVSS